MEPGKTGRTGRFIAGAVITIIVTGLAIVVLTRTLAQVSVEDVLQGMRAVGWIRVAGALLFTAACYLALSGYDHIALNSIGKPVRWKRSILGSTAAYALSHNLGFAPVTATYARHRVYGRDGVGLADVARVVVLTGAAFWLGVVFVMGLCLVAFPGIMGASAWALSRPMQMALGLVVIDVVVLYLLMIARGARVIGWRTWTVPLPDLKGALAQSGISLLEMALASAVLWILMPSVGLAGYPSVLVAYVMAFVMVLISHSPGGAGVLETVVILMLPDVPKAETLSALILFRIVFHLIPLVVAAVILLAHGGPKTATGTTV